MPLTPADYARAAMACRAAAVIAENDARAQSNPQTIKLFETEAKAYFELAARFDQLARNWQGESRK